MCAAQVIGESPASGIVIRNLSHHFGAGDSAKQVLYGINLGLPRGQVIIMTGPSGSGKTTLLTLIGALRTVQQGSIDFLGTELCGLSLREQVDVRRRIGFIFQAHNLFDSLTARQNVYMAMELRALPSAEKKQRAEQILTQLGLAERMDYRPQKLSGGQRQRVAIARALVNRPKVVLADEPTAALDKDTGRDVIELLRRLAHEDESTVIIVTHDSRIMEAADRIINLTDGTISSDLDVERTLHICQFIKSCQVFQNMLLNDLTDVAQNMDHETFAAGTKIIRQGEIGDRFYLIYKGSANVTSTVNGVVSKVADLGSGDYFGEVALLRGEPRNATVTAVSEVEAFSLSKERFLAAMQHHKSFEEQLVKTLFTR
jgi:putative ABC transport system ATP-binding protein